MGSMTCLGRYIWACKNVKWNQHMTFITSRISFLKHFQSSHLLVRDKAPSQNRARALHGASWDQGMVYRWHKPLILSLLVPTLPHSSVTMLLPLISTMMSGEGLCPYLVDKTVIVLLVISSLTSFVTTFPFRGGGKKDVCLFFPPPHHKRTCYWIPLRVIWCHSQGMCLPFPCVQE